MKILIIEPSGNLWGSEKALLDFVSSAINKADLAICYPCGSKISKKILELPVASYPYFVANLHKRKWWHKIYAIIGLFVSIVLYRPDVIYINQAGVTRLVKLLSKLFSIPVLTHVRMIDDVAYIESLLSDSSFLCEVVCISKYLSDMFTNNGIVKKERLHKLYDAYVPTINWEHSTSPEDVKKKDDYSFACVGRLDPSKGQQVLLEAISVLKKEGLMVNAIFVGEAGMFSKNYEDELFALAKELDLENSVKWVGFRSDVYSIISKSSAQVCPSYREALGRVLFEAWDAGRIPVVWQGSGGAAEVVKESGAGVLYKEQNGESLATAMKEVMNLTADEYQEMVRKGRNWLKQNCDPHAYADELIGICRSLAKNECSRRK